MPASAEVVRLPRSQPDHHEPQLGAPPTAYTVPVDTGDGSRAESRSMPLLWLVAIFLGSLELAWWFLWHVLAKG